VTYESISPDGRYFRCQISDDGKFYSWPAEDATILNREKTGILTDTGTQVTIEVDPAYQVPIHTNLKHKLERLVPLRDILILQR